MVSFTRTDVRDAILENNTARVVEMLEGFDLKKDSTPHFTADGRDLVSTMLGFASIQAYCDLDDELARELIERTATMVNVFNFALFVAAATFVEAKPPANYDDIPKDILKALRTNEYSDDIAIAIEAMDEEAFSAMLTFITSREIRKLDIRFTLPIIRVIYQHDVIPTDVMFSYMAIALREPDSQLSTGILGALICDGVLDELLPDLLSETEADNPAIKADDSDPVPGT